jgi:hypothetical protein
MGRRVFHVIFVNVFKNKPFQSTVSLQPVIVTDCSIVSNDNWQPLCYANRPTSK